MVIEWAALEDAQNRPENGPITNGNVATDQDLDDQIDAAFASIGDEF